MRVSSGHFTVLTDAGEAKGRQAAVRFEQMRSTFAQLLMKSRINLSLPLQIIVLNGDAEYSRQTPVRGGTLIAPGFYLPGADRDYVVLNSAPEDAWRAVSHQFAHSLLRYNYPPTPLWFDEGFAIYLSSLEIEPKQSSLGSDPERAITWQENTNTARGPSLVETLQTQPWIPFTELMVLRSSDAVTRDETPRNMFHAESWMLMHYLLNQEKMSETGTYFELIQVQKLPIEDAAQKAYGMSTAQLEKAVKDYFQAIAPTFRAQAPPADPRAPAAIHYSGLPVNPEDVGVSDVTLTPFEGRALLAEMTVRIPERRDQGVLELKSILTDPKGDNVIVHRALGWVAMENGKYSDAVEQLNGAMDVDPKDVWTRYLLALVKYRTSQNSGLPIQGLPNMMQDIRIVLDWYPEFAEAYNMLAVARLEGGGNNSAMDAIREAIQLSPRDDSYQLNMAKIYMAQKKWDTATALLQRLVTSSDPQVAKVAKLNLDDLPTLKKYGVLPQRKAEIAPKLQTREQTQAAPIPPQAAPSSEDSEPAPPAEPAPDTRKVLYLKGRVVSVDCSQSPSAAVVFSSLQGHQVRLWANDYKTLLLIGADGFSCDWKNRQAIVNYKQGGHLDGDIVSLELE
jgi:tetratricopeptide (TPR) repeat protein